jgi:5-formyltetrahydrofolate cyclo-ligase
VENEQSVAEEKRVLRALIRGRRAARTQPARDADALRLAEAVTAFLADDIVEVSCYMSLATEPATAQLIDALIRSGRRPWLPRIDGNDLAWIQADSSTTYRDGPLGIREPTGASTPRPASTGLLLMPALAVDRTGRRLGQGGGYYDRVLAGLPEVHGGGPLRAVLVFDDEVLDHVPAEAHDKEVDIIFTPLRTIRASRRA